MYDENLVKPMREELTSLGFLELKNPEQVDQELKDFSGCTLVVVNSVCGCAAGACRPAVKLALTTSEKKPAKLTTVFAGQDQEATAQARSYFTGYKPSSPAIALIKDGKIAAMIERTDIEGRSASDIAEELKQHFSELC
ncbi:MAG: BrxA/BrxB family bacilliredoxin [Bdellovibrionales bacterium]|nr:BrxA/BrxB family bacilliredoxin [Bdellovibrionales bacterium]